MNPSSTEQSGLNLPPPVANQAPVSASPEAPQSAPNLVPANGQSAAPATQLPPLPVMSATPQPVADDVVTTASAVVPSTADDGDLIEKEWVHKAKSIVDRTREDPYVQSKELTEFRADYMQKRYNKTIKLSE